MKYLSKKPVAIALSALILPLASGALFLASSSAAQAHPQSHAPAYGYRNKANKGNKGNKGNKDWKNDRDRDKRDDRYEDDRGTHYDENDGNFRDRDRDGYDDRFDDDHGNDYDDRDDDRNNRNARTITVTGIVTHDGNSERRFTIRANNGQTYIVRTEGSEPRRLSVGDRVTVTGRINERNERNVIRAHSVRIIAEGSGNDNIGQRVDFTGTIISFQTNSRFTIRRDGTNNVYTVQSRDNEQSAFNRGDRARVVGTLSSNNFVQATDVDRVSGSGSHNNGNRQSVNFTGTVVGNDNGTLIVRGDNGKMYRVLYRSSIATGTRIRVQADVLNGVITATDINRL